MTDKKISQLVAVTSVDDADEFVLARSGTSNKITGANLAASVSGSQSATATVTTDPNTFVVEHVFDLAQPGWAYLRATALALVADGETWGGAGIGAHVDATTSTDGITYTSAGFSPADINFDGLGYLSVVGHYDGGAGLHLRYLKIILTVIAESNGLVYTGANHPTMQVQLDLTYA